MSRCAPCFILVSCPKHKAIKILTTKAHTAPKGAVRMQQDVVDRTLAASMPRHLHRSIRGDGFFEHGGGGADCFFVDAVGKANPAGSAESGAGNTEYQVFF